MTSDSESEYEQQVKASKQVVPFKWSVEYEDQLEQILIRNFFDFNAAAREFSKIINSNPTSQNWYQIDAKSLQLRWTDIEIRKYRLGNNKEESQEDHVEIDEPLPPLEENPPKHQDQARNENEGNNEENEEGEEDTGPVYTNLEEVD